MPIGEIKLWNDRGFGFIADDEEPQKRWSFAHVTQFPHSAVPCIGDVYEYDLITESDGRARAINLQPFSPAREECARVFGDDD